MKNVIRAIGIIYLLPGFLFDVCIGLAYIMNDGRPDGHGGDWLGEWSISVAYLLPVWARIALMPGVFISALPAGLFCLALTIGLSFGLVYIMNGIFGSVLSIPFTGKIRWRTLTSLGD